MLRAENKSDHEADAGNDISFPYLSENWKISKRIQGFGTVPVKIRNTWNNTNVILMWNRLNLDYIVFNN